MNDIARLAKVSKPTVSRVINGSDLVNEKTKKHVMEIALKHGYSVNRNAQKLRQNKTNTIVVSVDFESYPHNHISDPFIFELLAGVSEALSNQGQDLVLCSHKNNNANSLRSLLLSGTADGIIFLGQGHRDLVFNELSELNTPFVVWGATTSENKDYAIVGSDNFLGGQLVAQYFESLGRQKLAFLGDARFDEIYLRRKGFLATAKDFNASVVDVNVDGFSFEAAYAAVVAYFKQAIELPEAIFACGDTSAMATIRALGDLGIAIHDQVMVVGYNDIQTSAYFSPPITTIRQDTTLAGKSLVEVLMSVINGHAYENKYIPTELIVRSS